MEQEAWDTVTQIIAGVLFLTPLKAMFRRVLKSLKDNPEEESFFEYHFPSLYHRFHKG